MALRPFSFIGPVAAGSTRRLAVMLPRFRATISSPTEGLLAGLPAGVIVLAIVDVVALAAPNIGP